MPCPSLWGWCYACGAAGPGHPGNEEPCAVPSTQPVCAPAFFAATWSSWSLGCQVGAQRHPGRVQGPSAAGAAWPCCGVSCFLSARGGVCFRLFSSCSAQRRAGPPALAPTAGSRGTRGSGFDLAHRRVSRELSNSCAAVGARDPCGFVSCNLAFTRLQGCKCL